MLSISSAMDFSLLLTVRVFVRYSNLLIIPLLTLPTAIPQSHVQVHCLQAWQASEVLLARLPFFTLSFSLSYLSSQSFHFSECHFIWPFSPAQ